MYLYSSVLSLFFLGLMKVLITLKYKTCRLKEVNLFKNFPKLQL